MSGRTAADAARVVGVEGIRYVGEHGLELADGVDEWAGRLETFAAGVDWPSERGKRLSLSFHFRESADEAAAERLREPSTLRRALARFMRRAADRLDPAPRAWRPAGGAR